MLADRVRQEFDLNTSLYEGGNRQLHFRFLEGEDENTATVCVVELEISIAYHGYGISYYSGVFFWDGSELVQIKPTLRWRDGQNQRNDNRGNRWMVSSFTTEGGQFVVKLYNGYDRKETWRQ